MFCEKTKHFCGVSENDYLFTFLSIKFTETNPTKRKNRQKYATNYPAITNLIKPDIDRYLCLDIDYLSHIFIENISDNHLSSRNLTKMT